MTKQKLLGPFVQVLTMSGMPLKGALKDEQLEIIPNAGMLINDGKIEEIGDFDALFISLKGMGLKVKEVQKDMVVLPGFIDPHTHICWAGKREKDYAMRLAGVSYIDIAKQGGGIWSTVSNTRNAKQEALVKRTRKRANNLLQQGVTTIEVKSGYGLSVEHELKILRAIKEADKKTKAELIPTCLAAHICPNDFDGKPIEYLKHLVKDLLPQVKQENLASRIDIFIEETAFSEQDAAYYLNEARKLGFDIAIHGDQFTTGGSSLATELRALSVDHLEASQEKEIEMLAKSDVTAIALPGASIGLGEPFAPARRLLDAGACLAIGSDWNPGSAPMGDILVQASMLQVYEKLSMAETLAALTYRSAATLKLNDRGIIAPGSLADLIAFEVDDYREILYNQGRIKPTMIWKNGKLINKK